jgi:hypothetical protein
MSSRSGYFIAIVLDKSRAVIPEEIHEVLEPYLTALENDLDPVAEEGPQTGAGDSS